MIKNAFLKCEGVLKIKKKMGNACCGSGCKFTIEQLLKYPNFVTDNVCKYCKQPVAAHDQATTNRVGCRFTIDFLAAHTGCTENGTITYSQAGRSWEKPYWNCISCGLPVGKHVSAASQ